MHILLKLLNCKIIEEISSLLMLVSHIASMLYHCGCELELDKFSLSDIYIGFMYSKCMKHVSQIFLL